MFLSIIELDLVNPYIVQSLTNMELMHKNIMTMFKANREEEQVLFSLYNSDNGVRCIVQSKNMPCVTDKTIGMTFISSRNIAMDYDKMLQTGKTISFMMNVAPVKRLRREGKNSSKVYISSLEERVAWLTKQADRHGFKVLRATEMPVTKQDFYHGMQKGSIYGNQYTGILTITDASKFMNLIKIGIGTGKPYGFGMFLLHEN